MKSLIYIVLVIILLLLLIGHVTCSFLFTFFCDAHIIMLITIRTVIEADRAEKYKLYVYAQMQMQEK